MTTQNNEEEKQIKSIIIHFTEYLKENKIPLSISILTLLNMLCIIYINEKRSKEDLILAIKESYEYLEEIQKKKQSESLPGINVFI